MNRMARIITTILLFFALAGIHQPLFAQSPQLSVTKLPAVEGADEPQVAVKWSGELPVPLEVGVVHEDRGFVATGQAVELTEVMTLLPHPEGNDAGPLVWRVEGEEVQEQTHTRGASVESEWRADFFGPGVDSTIWASTVYEGELVLGGSFQIAGDKVVDHLVRWDGSTWSLLSETGMNDAVYALTVYEGDLIAGGSFTTAGGVSVNRIARWDGSHWTTLSGPSAMGMNNAVQALVVMDGNLFAGGVFTSAGGVTVNHIARWDGAEWSALSGPLATGTSSAVFSLAVFDGGLVAGGDFATAGGVTVNHIARWDGDNWSALSGPSGVGVNSSSFATIVYALAVFDGDLIAGGQFITAGGLTVNGIARWDGLEWSALSGPSASGVTGQVRAFSLHDGDLIAGGSFNTAGGITVNNIARWNGSEWSELSGPSGTGVNSTIMTLAVLDSSLIASGSFTRAAGLEANRIAIWDGVAWSSTPWTGVDDKVTAFTVYGGNLIAGGFFNRAGGLPVGYIARWNGTAWSALTGPVGAGVSNWVEAVTEYDGELIVGGAFHTAGGVQVSKIARWDGNEWADLSGPSGTGVTSSGGVRALTVYNDELIAGGAFTSIGGVTVNYIARWNGSQWTSLDGPSGTGVGGEVHSLAVYNGELIAGGSFSTAGGLTVNRIARWNGSDWASLDGPSATGVDGQVNALAVYDGKLIAGGWFSTAGGETVNHIASWNGSEWASLDGSSSAGVNSVVSALTVHNSELFAGGSFSAAGGETVNRITSWDGSQWAALTGPSGTGVDDGSVTALITYDDDLTAGGDFTSAGGIPSWRIGRYVRSYTVGGNVSGLAGSGLVLQNNGGDDLAISSDGEFTFPTALDDGSDYNVTVATQPTDPSQTCTVSNGTGALAGADVTHVDVNCSTDTYTVTTTATNGTITSTLDPVVEWGQTTVVTGEANANHYFASVEGCSGTEQSNTDQSITGFSYETGAIEADCTVSAEFSIRTYSMSSTVGSGQGTIDVLSPVVEHGSDADFEVMPDSGWLLQSFTGDTCTPSDNGDGTWTATAISADCEVTAEFIEDTTSVLTPSMSTAIVGMPVTYTIQVTGTASAPADGQIELVSDLSGVICTISEASLTNAETATFSCQHTWNEAGEHQLTATFEGSATHDDSEAQFQQGIVASEKVFQDRFQSE